MASIFVFNGGNYKVNLDSGRDRVPLTPEEGEMIFADPEFPGNYEDNSIKSRLNMLANRGLFCNLAAGDEIFFGLVPDATMVMALWAMPFNAIPGFTGTFDLVSIADVYADYIGANAGGVAGVAGVTPLPVDFSLGLGDATCDVAEKVKLFGGVAADYRNLNALQSALVTPPVLAGLGKAMYMRLTVGALGEFNTDDCCNNCDENMSDFEAGVLYIRMCADKQRVLDYCNCGGSSCGDDAECNDQNNNPQAPEPNPPHVP